MAQRPYFRAWRTKWLGAPNTAANTVPATAGLDCVNQAPQILSATIRNTGETAQLAIVGLLKDTAWWAGQASNIQASVTVDTTDAQSAAANDFALEVANAANSGCMFGATLPFGAVSIATTTNSAGSPVRVVEYWNGAWTTISNTTGMIIAQPANWLTTATEDLLVFVPPVDWVKGGSGTNVNQNTYNLRVRCTTAPTTAGLASRVYLGMVFAANANVAANAEYNAPWGPGEAWLVPPSVAAVGALANGANEMHQLTILYR